MWIHHSIIIAGAGSHLDTDVPVPDKKRSSGGRGSAAVGVYVAPRPPSWRQEARGTKNPLQPCRPQSASLRALPSANPSPRPKRHLDRFSHFSTFFAQITAELLYFRMGCPSSKAPPLRRGIWSHVIHGSKPQTVEPYCVTDRQTTLWTKFIHNDKP